MRGRIKVLYDSIYPKMKRIPKMKNNISDIVLGTLVADTYSLGSHWVYDETQLQDLPIELPKVSNNITHVWHLFVIKTKERERFSNFMTNRGIQTLIHYPIPPHKQQAYSQWNNMQFEITESIHNQVISLPLSLIISTDELNKIIACCNEFT